MEEVCLRFSHLSENIFDSLSNKSIAKCTRVSRFWHDYINGQKFVEIRKIKLTVGQFHTIGDAWKKLFDTASTKTIVDLGHVVNQLYKQGNAWRTCDGLTPLHVAAGTGQLILYQNIEEKTYEKYPKDIHGHQPFLYAANNGHLEVCELIIEGLGNKNPAKNDGWTPLHSAANKGHIKICELIMESLENKNPAMNDGGTPLHFATHLGHIEIYELIMELSLIHI